MAQNYKMFKILSFFYGNIYFHGLKLFILNWGVCNLCFLACLDFKCELLYQVYLCAIYHWSYDHWRWVGLVWWILFLSHFKVHKVWIWHRQKLGMNFFRFLTMLGMCGLPLKLLPLKMSGLTLVNVVMILG